MSILFKAVPKGQPGVVGGGTIKYYAGIIREQPVKLRKFASEIAKMSSLTTSDVFAVLESFLERLHTYMEEGRIIQLGDLGSFSPYLASKAEDSPREVDLHSITKMRVGFRPSKELRKRLSVVEFLKQGTDTDGTESIAP
ncbi:MAG: HU family DNA-binding protein [Cyclobacteriaceae bacterium]|nr:HU family DNA-binding protein [Cyclobacteriaceae bacterium SS2]